MNKEDILIVSALEVETQNKLDDYKVLYTGVGKVNATYNLMDYLLGRCLDKPKLIINYGTGASKHFKDKVVDCTKFIQGDMDAEELGFDKGTTPYEDDIPTLLDYSQSDIVNPLKYNLTCYTGDKFRTPGQYEDVVDMEAYALAKVCWFKNIDFISYKYITDDGSADDWKENCSKGVNKFKEILKSYVL